MATPLDMSLDDMVNRNYRERVRGQGRFLHSRGRERGRGPVGSFSSGRMMGPYRRGPLAVNAPPSSYPITKRPGRTKSFQWKHDLFEDSLKAAGISEIEIGTKLYVSNLDYGVTKEDIRELFSEIGDLKRFAIHFDKNCQPSGSAEVVYTRRSDAFAAMKRYNNVMLDGRPMKIEIVGSNAEMPISARVNVTGVNGRKKRTVVITPGPGQPGSSAMPTTNRDFGRTRRGRRRNDQRMRNDQDQGRRGRRRGRGKKKPTEKSVDELDKELESYRAEAMQT